MIAAPQAPHEAERLHALREYGVLDTAPEAAFDDLVALAARVCGTPISLVSFVDRDRQWWKAQLGITETEAARNGSFCATAIEQEEDFLVVPDATRDRRFATSQMVTGRHAIRFYAGAVLRTQSGHAIGTLCVMDREFRTLQDHQVDTLRTLARQVMVQLELRRALAAVRTSEDRYRQVFKHNPIPLFVFDVETLRYLAVNDAAVVRYGYTEAEFLRMTLMDLRPEAERPALRRELAKADRGLIFGGRWKHQRKDGSILPVEIHAHSTVFDGRPARIIIAIDVTEQERAVTAFRASEERFRALSESAPIGIFECDADGKTTYCNSALLAIVGRSIEEVLGSGWIDAIHPEDRASVQEEAQRLLPAGQTSNLEHRVLRPDGSMRWVHLMASPRQRDPQGRVSSFVGTLEDITEKRVTEVAMLESEERYRRLLMLSPDAHFVQVDNRVTLVNDAFCKLLGAARPEQLIGRPLYDIIHPDFHHQVRERQTRVLAGYPAPPLEQKFIRLDGSIIEVEATAAAVAIDFQGRTEVQVIARDITARRVAESALRDSEERFKLVARAVSDVIWDWNIEKKTIWRSASYETIFGLSSTATHAGGDGWATRIHPADRERVTRGLRQAIDTGKETWVEEYRFLRRDGSYASVQDRGQIVRDPAGKPCRMVGGMTDLSEKKKLEQQYLRAQRMESIGTLAGGIAHDLNNVLAPIMMSIDLLKMSAANDPKQMKLLDTIQTSTYRGADLVRQVLTFARGLDGQRIAVNLRHLFRDLQRIISETFPRKIRILNDAHPDVWPVLGDATQIHQVLLNLAVNARDAMRESGTLALAATNATLDGQFVANTPDAKTGPYVVLSVSDTGSGISPEIRDRIFEPFFTTKEVGKGTGLGLATVHAIVKSHGGFITLHSEVGLGTTFKVYLPADPALRPAPPAPSQVAPPRGQGELVLVVDDEAAVRQITQQTLEAFGYRVRTANDGAEAVSIYSKHAKEIALVITDMMMPVMDGAATIQVLQRLNPLVKIIAASGLNANENVTRAASLGVSNFLSKPYTSETMLTMLRKVLDQPAAPAAR
ncbi:MAG TPA: PAS domain S-box protein [Opitutaceae bacterium]|nr:PAS domain S-box protein [Opitutaceae bacterium]